jgi:hypothetical protein
VLAKQVLSQLSYTPTVGVPFILKHFRRFQNPFLRFSTITVGTVSRFYCLTQGFTTAVLKSME